MIKLINLFFKGIIIGIAKIIPGLSGSVLAISFGIYEEALGRISKIFKNFKNNVYYLSILVLGIVLGIIIGAFVIKYLIFNMYYMTMFLFIGLIVGVTIKFDFKINSNIKKIFLILLSIMFTFLILKNNYSVNEFVYENNLLNNVYTFFIGIIDAFSTIVPGISGTAIFISLGVYDFVLKLFSFDMLISSAFIYFFLGILFGIIIISLIMNYLFTYYKKITYNIIYILCVSSIFMMIFKIDYSSMNFIYAILSFFSFITGIFISKSIS